MRCVHSSLGSQGAGEPCPLICHSMGASWAQGCSRADTSLSMSDGAEVICPLDEKLPSARVALPILNPGPCPSPGMLTPQDPQASFSPGLGTAPQSTGTWFPAAFMRSLRLRHESLPIPHPALTPLSPTLTQPCEEWATHTSQHSLLLRELQARLTYAFPSPFGGDNPARGGRNFIFPPMVVPWRPGLLK